MTQRDKIIPGPNVVKPIKGLILPRNVAEKIYQGEKIKALESNKGWTC